MQILAYPISLLSLFLSTDNTDYIVFEILSARYLCNYVDYFYLQIRCTSLLVNQKSFCFSCESPVFCRDIQKKDAQTVRPYLFIVLMYL